jgi:hypothetical protein
MLRLNKFILDVPYLFLMKVPYLWLPAVMFFTWPPLFSLMLTGIILLGLLAMYWQNSAWVEKVKRDFADDPGSIYIETLRPPANFVIRNALLLVVVSVAIGWALNGRLGMNGYQWGLIVCGFMALYRKALLFGKGVTYILTDQGIGIRYAPGHIDYRLLIRFSEIWSVKKTGPLDKIPISWTVIAPMGKVTEGLLLTPKNLRGFSAQLDHIVLSSSDLENLLQKFPAKLIRPA